ncbi:MAG: hypothetical protein WBV28_20310 [Terracidiphilus sp.]
MDEKIQLLGWQALFAPVESGPATRAVSVLGFIPGVPRLGIPDLQMTDSVEGGRNRRSAPFIARDNVRTAS